MARERHRAAGPSVPGPRAKGRIGVLALQGSFPLHLEALARIGVEARAVRKPRDLEGIAGLIIPGGESTVMSRLARDYGLFDPLRALLKGGLPAFGTCAGAILLGKGDGPPPRLEAVDVDLLRNAYGSQLDSFTAELSLEGSSSTFHGVFIRAPRIGDVREPGARVLGTHAGAPVLVEAGSCLLATFHPELTQDSRVHERFVEMCLTAPRVARS